MKKENGYHQRDKTVTVYNLIDLSIVAPY